MNRLVVQKYGGSVLLDPEAYGRAAHHVARCVEKGRRVVAVVSPQSAPMRRLREEASGRGKLVDATQGRRTRSILVTDSDHVVLSAINPETIASRLGADESGSGGA